MDEAHTVLGDAHLGGVESLRQRVVDGRVETHAIEPGLARRSGPDRARCATGRGRTRGAGSGHRARGARRRCGSIGPASSCDVSMKNVLNTTKTSANVAVDRHVGHVADRRRGSSSPPGLARSCATIAGDASMPCTSTPRARERERDAARADPELERAAARRELGREVALRRACSAACTTRRRRRRRARRRFRARSRPSTPSKQIAARVGTGENRRRAHARPTSHAVPEHAQRHRSRGLRRHLHLRRAARPVLPAAARGRAHRAGAAHDRGRDRVRAQPDDARADRRTTCSSRRSGRFNLGLGTQIKPHIEKRFSMPWSQPGGAHARAGARDPRDLGDAGTRARRSTSAASSTRTR